jgi:hypothetical protein
MRGLPAIIVLQIKIGKYIAVGVGLVTKLEEQGGEQPLAVPLFFMSKIEIEES